MEEGFSEGGYGSLEEYAQDYVETFLWLQQGEDRTPELFEKRRRRLEERERETGIFLPAVCLRKRYFLSQAEYWIVMFAFCCELDGGLCLNYRERYRENWPNLQYILHLLSYVMPICFRDVAGLCGGDGALRDVLVLGADEPEERERRGFLQEPLLLNAAVFHFLLTGELPQEDWYTIVEAGENAERLEENEPFPLHEREYGLLCGYLGMEEPLRILLYGRAGSGKHTLVRRVCRERNAGLLILKTKNLLSMSRVRRTHVRQVLRLTGVIWNTVTVLELAEEFPGSSGEEEWEELRTLLFQNLDGSHLCILAQTRAQSDLVREHADIQIALKEELSREEKRLALDAWAAPEGRGQWQEELPERYRLNIGEWEKRWKKIFLRAQAEGKFPADREIWLEVFQERQEAFRFGKLIEDRFAPDEIILPEDCRRQLDTVIRLAKAWRGEKGLQILFHGNSGTGKTMAASVIAGQLHLPLLKVDLSQVFDKYIGETEKHIDEIFRRARRNHYLLFFDEADALFAKRTAVRDSHDRYANVSASFLLQRMEEYEGILILATNLRDHFDDAFVRRIRFAVKFRNLDREGRERLWRKVLEGDRPVAAEVDFKALSEAAELSPARISAAAYVAKLLAACDGNGSVTKGHLLEALTLEAGKDETAIKGF